MIIFEPIHPGSGWYMPAYPYGLRLSFDHLDERAALLERLPLFVATLDDLADFDFFRAFKTMFYFRKEEDRVVFLLMMS